MGINESSIKGTNCQSMGSYPHPAQASLLRTAQTLEDSLFKLVFRLVEQVNLGCHIRLLLSLLSIISFIVTVGSFLPILFLELLLNLVVFYQILEALVEVQLADVVRIVVHLAHVDVVRFLLFLFFALDCRVVQEELAQLPAEECLLEVVHSGLWLSIADAEIVSIGPEHSNRFL